MESLCVIPANKKVYPLLELLFVMLKLAGWLAIVGAIAVVNKKNKADKKSLKNTSYKN